MQIPRIYTPKNLTQGSTLSLDPQASQHVLRVLRMRVGDSLIIFNGQGGEYDGKLIEINKNSAVIELLRYQEVNRESPLRIHLVQGISRGERMDYVVQKATELGVALITPLFTERCTVKLSDDRLEKRIEHWRSIAISAAEQSGRCRVPEIRAALSLKDYLAQHQGDGFICDTESHYPLRHYLPLAQALTLLIGPEGGFAEDEIQQVKEKSFHSLSLGPRILRTETAPVVAITLLQSCAGDL